jgi:hypothetical protein
LKSVSELKSVREATPDGFGAPTERCVCPPPVSTARLPPKPSRGRPSKGLQDSIVGTAHDQHAANDVLDEELGVIRLTHKEVVHAVAVDVGATGQ